MTVRIVVQGRVQGVGFRFFVARKAEELGVKGCVWNRRDGAVEIAAAADEDRLALFEAALRAGPGFVSTVSVVRTNEAISEVAFTIDRTRSA